MLEIPSILALCEETATEHSPFLPHPGRLPWLYCACCPDGDGGNADWPCDTAIVLMALVVVETQRGAGSPYES